MLFSSHSSDSSNTFSNTSMLFIHSPAALRNYKTKYQNIYYFCYWDSENLKNYLSRAIKKIRSIVVESSWIIRPEECTEW